MGEKKPTRSLQVEVVLASSLSAGDKDTVWEIFANAMQGM